MGRSSGVGSKGQNSHSAKSLSVTFEGGQSPLWRRTPKFGQMHKRFREELEPLNLDRLQLWIDMGRIDATACVAGARGCVLVQRAAAHTRPLPPHAAPSRSRPCSTLAA